MPLHLLSSPFACGALVQTSQTLPIWCLTQHRQFGAAVPPMATCLGPCEVSGVAIKSISRFRPMFKCSVNTALRLAFSCGRVEEPAQPRQFLVGDLCASSRKLHTHISARQATVPAVGQCHPAWSWEGKAGDRWQQPGRLCAPWDLEPPGQ